jgi:hypothetical protein
MLQVEPRWKIAAGPFGFPVWRMGVGELPSQRQSCFDAALVDGPLLTSAIYDFRLTRTFRTGWRSAFGAIDDPWFHGNVPVPVPWRLGAAFYPPACGAAIVHAWQFANANAFPALDDVCGRPHSRPTLKTDLTN